MLCWQARKRLTGHHWQPDAINRDKELLAHLKKCPKCYSLILTENTLGNDFETVRKDIPTGGVTLGQIKATAEAIQNPSGFWKLGNIRWLRNLATNLLPGKRYRYAFGIIVVIFGFMAFVPFNFKEKTGYEVAIAGVDKNIAEDNPEITSLFCALGMGNDKTSALNDSLDTSKIRLNVGECRETCYLTISDLKTEKDVRIIIKTIMELGCCQIDKVIPIFHIESSSLLKHIAKQLIS
jgi:hypothetical protein